MKHIHFDVDKDGFYGAYWTCKNGSDCAIITMLGDDPEDYVARSAVKWILKLGVNVMTMSPGKKDYGHHNYPLERIETAVNWLKTHGTKRSALQERPPQVRLLLRRHLSFRTLRLPLL